MFRGIAPVLVLCAVSAFAGTTDVQRGEAQFQKTEYEAALRLVKDAPATDGPAQYLAGRSYFMLGEFKKASEVLEKATATDANNSNYFLWLGRAYGRRAETASPFTAPGLAVKSRTNLEKAVALDGKNIEAIDDLFEYYLQAPGFLGGGMDKATELVGKIGHVDPVEVHFALARIAERKKEYKQAEMQLRRCVELAPHQVGRTLDLAKFLAKQGRVEESDAAFQAAEKVAPNSPKLLFARASLYIQTNRNLDTAKQLLEQYMKSTRLTPDDPSREDAHRLLQKAGGR